MVFGGRRPGLARWVVAWVALSGLQLFGPLLPGGGRPIGSAPVLFWFVVVSASLCAVTSAAILVRAWREDTAELGLHGAFFMAVSLLPLVHGLTTPGVLYGPNDAATSAVLWVLPLAVMAQSPLLVPRRMGARVLGAWRCWVALHVVAQVGIATALLVRPSTLPAFEMGHGVAIALAVTSVALTMAVSARQLRLYWIGRSNPVLVVSLAFAAVGAGNLVWVSGTPMHIGFWIAHVLDVVGVFGGTVIGFIALRRGDLERRVLRPIVSRDPLDALELGLDPVVRDFVADLETKDSITAEHVARTAETAMAVGVALGLNAPQLRQLGLGALLHDIGKLEIDDRILNKPGRLTEAEFEHVKTHAVIGERLVASSRVIAEVAPIVRHHHERIDGNGYPDGLRGDRIPLLARIVSVCDAYDAMVHTRQYRSGMGSEKAAAVLREHAGSQWDADAVRALLELADQELVPPAPTVLADVAHHVGCSCLHEVPLPAGAAR